MASEITVNNGFAALLYFVAGALFVVGLEIPAIAVADGSFTSGKLRIGLTIAAVGLVFFLGAQHGQALQEWLGPTFSGSVNAVVLDFRVWIGFAWTILAISAVRLVVVKSGDHARLASLSQDIATVRRDMNRYVMPRRLTPAQTTKIANYLAQHEPHEVTFEIIKDDNEAGLYRSDIDTAFRQGGWTVKEYKYPSEVGEGLSYQFMRTPEHAQAPSDPKHPNAAELLDEAFRQAKVQIDGSSGGGSAPNLTADSLSIKVGHRRRDGYGYGSPRMVVKEVPEEE